MAHACPLAQEESVLTKDALNDTRFRDAASVVAFSIHSAMCVPLRGRSGVEGALYIDSCAKHNVFSEADLELPTAIGCVAGVAVENAALFEDTGFRDVDIRVIRKRTSKKELFEFVVSARKPDS